VHACSFARALQCSLSPPPPPPSLLPWCPALPVALFRGHLGGGGEKRREGGGGGGGGGHTQGDVTSHGGPHLASLRHEQCSSSGSLPGFTGGRLQVGQKKPLSTDTLLSEKLDGTAGAWTAGRAWGRCCPGPYTAGGTPMTGAGAGNTVSALPFSPFLARFGAGPVLATLGVEPPGGLVMRFRLLVDRLGPGWNCGGRCRRPGSCRISP